MRLVQNPRTSWGIRILSLLAALAVAALLLHLVLNFGWYASGLWSDRGVCAQDAAEVEAVEAELSFRLRSIERAALLRAGELVGDEALRLGQLCLALRPAA